VLQVLWKWKQKQKGVKPIRFLDELDQEIPQENLRELVRDVARGRRVVDMVNHPPHYTQGGIETIDFIEAKELPYNLGNVVKYITRADHKGSKLEDLRKARWYLDREITRITPPLP